MTDTFKSLIAEAENKEAMKSDTRAKWICVGYKEGLQKAQKMVEDAIKKSWYSDKFGLWWYISEEDLKKELGI